MLTAIRGTYDGKTFRPLASERLPRIVREVPVAIIFLEPIGEESQQLQMEAAQWMKAIRAQMLPLDISIKEMIEEGRER
jgi:hypothetical protein